MNENLFSQKAGLYIHIPFCIRKCPYCDFYSTTDRSLIEPFIEALMVEMALRPCPDLVFDSVYIGGGTPSILEEKAVSRIIAAVNKAFTIEPDAEITIEANPGTISGNWLKACRSAGINRINLGVQSFDDANLEFLGRIHTAGESETALKKSESAGFENIGLDLIYALPGQAPENWRDDLAAALRHAPAHLSCYMLTFETGTPMDTNRIAGLFHAAPESRQAAFFLDAREHLQKAGYDHYEISNYARSRALRSRHNAKYWNNAPYIGLGPAAHSYTEPVRSWNVRSVSDYIRLIAAGNLPVTQSETLDRQQRMIEAVYLGLRQSDGIDYRIFRRRFGADFMGMFSRIINRFTESGDMIADGRGCRLTGKGMLLQEAIAGEFIEEI